MRLERAFESARARLHPAVTELFLHLVGVALLAAAGLAVLGGLAR